MGLQWRGVDGGTVAKMKGSARGEALEAAGTTRPLGESFRGGSFGGVLPVGLFGGSFGGALRGSPSGESVRLLFRAAHVLNDLMW